jgi:hypothetical protein
MAENESQTIFKIVIPFEEYHRLKTIEVQFHNLQKQFVAVQSEKKKDKLVDDSENKAIQENNQKGNGENSESEINAAGSSVLVPTLLQVNDKPLQPNQPIVTYNKCDESDNFEDSRLLSTVPKAHQQRAQALLKVINDRSAELTWNKDGIIIIDQTAIPETNIFDIFRYLFIRQKPIHAKGFLELNDKLQLMGLSHFINIRHRVKVANEIKKKEIKDASFWYLG